MALISQSSPCWTLAQGLTGWTIKLYLSIIRLGWKLRKFHLIHFSFIYFQTVHLASLVYPRLHFLGHLHCLSIFSFLLFYADERCKSPSGSRFSTTQILSPSFPEKHSSSYTLTPRNLCLRETSSHRPRPGSPVSDHHYFFKPWSTSCDHRDTFSSPFGTNFMTVADSEWPYIALVMSLSHPWSTLTTTTITFLLKPDVLIYALSLSFEKRLIKVTFPPVIGFWFT